MHRGAGQQRIDWLFDTVEIWFNHHNHIVDDGAFGAGELLSDLLSIADRSPRVRCHRIEYASHCSLHRANRCRLRV